MISCLVTDGKEGLGTDHVTSGPMKSLKKTAPNGTNRGTKRQTWRLYDWISPVGPILWNKETERIAVSPSWPGLLELHKGLGGGRSAHPLKKNDIWLKTIFFKVCHSLEYINIIILKIGLIKEQLHEKKLLQKILGGADLPPQAN